MRPEQSTSTAARYMDSSQTKQGCGASTSHFSCGVSIVAVVLPNLDTSA